MKIFIGTTSAIKRQGIQMVVDEFIAKQLINEPELHFEAVEASLSVTPLEDETYECAKERALEMNRRFHVQGDYFVGIENGLVTRHNEQYEECWCVIVNHRSELFCSYSSGVKVPTEIQTRMKTGQLHHEIMTTIGKENSRQTWGIYTNHIIKREESIKEAFRNAFYYAVSR